jgi:hypothetical protein
MARRETGQLPYFFSDASACQGEQNSDYPESWAAPCPDLWSNISQASSKIPPVMRNLGILFYKQDIAQSKWRRERKGSERSTWIFTNLCIPKSTQIWFFDSKRREKTASYPKESGTLNSSASSWHANDI